MLRRWMYLIFIYVSTLAFAQQELGEKTEEKLSTKSYTSGLLNDFMFYEKIVVKKAIFSDVAMTDLEKNLYAEYIAEYVADVLLSEGTTKEKILTARKCLLVAMHLSPKNKKAVQLNEGLIEETIPKQVSEFSAEALTTLLIHRARLLKKEKGENNRELAFAFMEISSEMTPHHDLLAIDSDSEGEEGEELNWRDIFKK